MYTRGGGASAGSVVQLEEVQQILGKERPVMIQAKML
jgi:hypothetical protein